MESNPFIFIGKWLFWNGLVPFFAILASFPIHSCIESGSLEPLLSCGNSGKDLGLGIAVIVAIIVTAFNLVITLIARLIYWTFLKVSRHEPLSSKAWPLETIRVFLGGFVAPFVASMLSTVVTVTPRAKFGENIFDVMRHSVTLQAIPYALATLALTVLLTVLLIGFGYTWRNVVATQS